MADTEEQDTNPVHDSKAAEAVLAGFDHRWVNAVAPYGLTSHVLKADHYFAAWANHTIADSEGNRFSSARAAGWALLSSVYAQVNADPGQVLPYSHTGLFAPLFDSIVDSGHSEDLLATSLRGWAQAHGSTFPDVGLTTSDYTTAAVAAMLAQGVFSDLAVMLNDIQGSSGVRVTTLHKAGRILVNIALNPKAAR